MFVGFGCFSLLAMASEVAKPVIERIKMTKRRYSLICGKVRQICTFFYKSTNFDAC